MFFDLNIKGSSLNNNVKLANEAAKYGWSHINFSYNQNDFKDALDFKDELSELSKLIEFAEFDSFSIFLISEKLQISSEIRLPAFQLWEEI